MSETPIPKQESRSPAVEAGRGRGLLGIAAEIGRAVGRAARERLGLVRQKNQAGPAGAERTLAAVAAGELNAAQAARPDTASHEEVRQMVDAIRSPLLSPTEAAERQISEGVAAAAKARQEGAAPASTSVVDRMRIAQADARVDSTRQPHLPPVAKPEAPSVQSELTVAAVGEQPSGMRQRAREQTAAASSGINTRLNSARETVTQRVRNRFRRSSVAVANVAPSRHLPPEQERAAMARLREINTQGGEQPITADTRPDMDQRREEAQRRWKADPEGERARLAAVRRDQAEVRRVGDAMTHWFPDTRNEAVYQQAVDQLLAENRARRGAGENIEGFGREDVTRRVEQLRAETARQQAETAAREREQRQGLIKDFSELATLEERTEQNQARVEEARQTREQQARETQQQHWDRRAQRYETAMREGRMTRADLDVLPEPERNGILSVLDRREKERETQEAREREEAARAGQTASIVTAPLEATATVAEPAVDVRGARDSDIRERTRQQEEADAMAAFRTASLGEEATPVRSDVDENEAALEAFRRASVGEDVAETGNQAGAQPSRAEQLAEEVAAARETEHERVDEMVGQTTSENRANENDAQGVGAAQAEATAAVEPVVETETQRLTEANERQAAMQAQIDTLTAEAAARKPETRFTPEQLAELRKTGEALLTEAQHQRKGSKLRTRLETTAGLLLGVLAMFGEALADDIQGGGQQQRTS